MSMPEVTQHAPGTPSWVDLASPDMDAAARFYEGLFGWQAVETGPVEETGGYRMLTLDGRNVAGLGPVEDESRPAMWTSYVSVADADETSDAIRDAGGRIIMETLDVMGAGRMAVLSDPTGAVLALWQPQSHHGADVVNEPGTLCWTELATRDVDAARRFYRAVFGWDAETNAYGETTYTEWKLGGRTIAGMTEMGETSLADVPAHWSVCFAVEDTDATATRAVELGGKVGIAPTDTPVGRFAVLNDPHGAVFSVIHLARPPQ
jgi:predicted enzyme related to lactoylglutathione lyase